MWVEVPRQEVSDVGVPLEQGTVDRSLTPVLLY